MIYYSHLSHWLRSPTPIRPIVNPYDWIAKLSQVLVQERYCRTGQSICNGDIASTIMQGIDLSLFREQQLETMVAAFNKYSDPPGSLGDDARWRLLNHRNPLQQYPIDSRDSMAKEGQSMKVGDLNSRVAFSSPSLMQHQGFPSGVTEVSTTTETLNSSAYLRPTTPTLSSLIARSNRFTPLPHYSKAAAAEPLPTGDASGSSIGLSSGMVNQPVLWGAWPVHGRFCRNRGALPTTPEMSRSARDTPNWLRQTAQLVAQMSCQSITSEQVISAVGGCLTGIKARNTPGTSEIIVQPDSPHWTSRC